MTVLLTVIPEHTNQKFLEMQEDDGVVRVNSRAIIEHGARVAGECYDQEGWTKLQNEDPAKTKRREWRTLGPDDGSGGGNEHATPYEHIHIGLEIVAPKILMMVLNNEQQCSTSEKSARYTKFCPENGVSELEAKLYGKWLGRFTDLIRDEYNEDFIVAEARKARVDFTTQDPKDLVAVRKAVDTRILKLAQENARYVTSVFTQTFMIHTAPWIQWNRIVGMMIDFINRSNKTPFETRLAEAMNEFVEQVEDLGMLDARAMSNRKQRKLRLFGDHAVNRHYSDSYSTSYMGSFAQLGQAHRHRTISYNMLRPTEPDDGQSFFFPPILPDEMRKEWETDLQSVGHNYPQGQMVPINECGTCEAFITKMKERLCSAAQLEIQQQTLETLSWYRLTEPKRFRKYGNGARCTFNDYTCLDSEKCFWNAGIKLTRKI